MRRTIFQILGTIFLLSVLTTFTVSQEVIENDKLIKVTDDVYLFGAGAFSLVVITGNGVVVVDPINPAQATELSEAIKGLTDQRIKYVLYSHSHWDHIGGGQVFKEQNAIFISHIDTQRALKPNPTVIRPQLTWEGSRSDLALGNKTIERYHFGPSHGKGMTIFRVAEDDLIFVVDLAVPKRLPFMTLPDFDIDGWIYTLSSNSRSTRKRRQGHIVSHKASQCF